MTEWTADRVRQWLLQKLYADYMKTPIASVTILGRADSSDQEGDDPPFDALYREGELLEEVGYIKLRGGVGGFESSMTPRGRLFWESQLNPPSPKGRTKPIGF
jgi:hypothetical protein